MTVTFDADERYWPETERPFRVLIEEWDGSRVELTVKAIDRKGAEGTAWQTAIDRGYDPCAVLRCEEVA